MTVQTFKCPYCPKKYVEKKSLYTHMEKEHYQQLNGLSPAQAYFNIRNNKTHGSCIMCKKETPFNESTEKYERLCSESCKNAYREQFRQRMIKKHGKDNLLNDPEVQKKMLANRKISGTYVWGSDHNLKFGYTGSYEHEFLEFMDIFLNWDGKDLFSPCPIVFDYKYEGKKHFYIPDFYIESLKLVIEVKSFENNHYRKRDIGLERAKEQVVRKQGYNYFIVHDKYYDDFFEYLIKLKK